MAGQTVSANFLHPQGNQQTCPLVLAPNGLLTGLLHLVAVAGAREGSLVSMDEFENTLHPFAIRQLLAAMRDWAGDHDLTVCLTTHSPVVLDEFREQPEQVWVFEEGQGNRPVPLTEVFEKDWLARFSLGRLYAHGEFGGQTKQTLAPATAKPH